MEAPLWGGEEGAPLWRRGRGHPLGRWGPTPFFFWEGGVGPTPFGTVGPTPFGVVVCGRGGSPPFLGGGGAPPLRGPTLRPHAKSRAVWAKAVFFKSGLLQKCLPGCPPFVAPPFGTHPSRPRRPSGPPPPPDLAIFSFFLPSPARVSFLFCLSGCR